MKKVKLTIERTTGVRGIIERIIEIEDHSTKSKTKAAAELKYINDYINRDADIAHFADLAKAKKYSKLKITSEIL